MTTDLKELARKIAILQDYSIQTGVKTNRSQGDLLRNLDGEQTVKVLEMVRDLVLTQAGR